MILEDTNYNSQGGRMRDAMRGSIWAAVAITGLAAVACLMFHNKTIEVLK